MGDETELDVTLGFALVQQDRPADARVHLERFARDASPTRHAQELEDVRWLLERLEEARRAPTRWATAG